MLRRFTFVVLGFLSVIALTIAVPISAETQSAELFFSTRSGTYTNGTTFEVPIFLNTHGATVQAVELHVKFDPRKVTIVKPSSGTSIIGVWTDLPKYSNREGTATFKGTITNGINTSSGLVTSITFKAIESGQAVIKINESSQVITSDGSAKNILTSFDRADFTVIPQLAEGAKVFSATHPFDERWYNNNNPMIGWEKEPDVVGFSYVLDNNPFTIPENVITGSTTATSYENLADGLWYFHIKAKKKKFWTATTHFLVRIDTEPPVGFTPTRETLTASVVNPTLVSFSTTDALSGVDRYEIGVIEKDTTNLGSPVFVQSESPYQIPVNLKGDVRVIVRAFDRAGNVRENSVDFQIVFSFTKFLAENSIIVLSLAIFSLALLVIIIVHYFTSHHLIKHARHIIEVLRKEGQDEHQNLP